MSKHHRRPPSFQQALGIPESAHGLKVRVTQGANRIENKTGGLPLEMAHNDASDTETRFQEDSGNEGTYSLILATIVRN